MRCLFCGDDLDDDEDTLSDDCGEIACKACGEAETEAQRREIWPAVPQKNSMTTVGQEVKEP